MDSNGGIQKVGKTELTRKAYLKRGSLLWKRAARDCGSSDGELLALDYLYWLENLLPSLKPASRRQYIASTREILHDFVINKFIPQNDKENLKLAISKSQTMQGSDYKPDIKINKRALNTSAQKAKKIEVDDLVTISKLTQNIKGKWINPALVWMGANIIIGLRPCEWQSATITEVDKEIILVVNNAKNTNGRSHGAKRHINITSLKPIELKLIKSQLLTIQNFVEDGGLWFAYYDGVRKTIHRITRKYLSRRKLYPTLYSSRHQFAANAKAAGMTKIELAALMGHAVDITAGFHYGKKKHGKGGCRVKPSSVDVAKVRVKSKPNIVMSGCRQSIG